MRHFQQNVLVSEDGKTIVERVYSTGEVEYWSVMNVGWQNGQQQGNAQIPFRIEVHGGGLYDPIPIIAHLRDEAFANFDAALKAAEPEAHASIKEKLQEQAKQHNAKLILAGAIPNIPIPRINGNGR